MHHADPVVVPSVILTNGEIWLEVEDHERSRVRDASALESSLRELRQKHSVSGEWVLTAEASTPYARMVRLMDAARAAKFPSVTLVHSGA